MRRVQMKLALALLLIIASVCSFAMGQQGENAPAPAAPQATNPEMTYRAGFSGVTVPKLIHSVDPIYSDEARRKKITGISLVSLIVNVDGEPENVRVIRSITENLKPKLQAAGQTLDDAAVTAVRQYRFEPSTLNGKSVPVEIHIEVHYKLYFKFF